MSGLLPTIGAILPARTTSRRAAPIETRTTCVSLCSLLVGETAAPSGPRAARFSPESRRAGTLQRATMPRAIRPRASTPDSRTSPTPDYVGLASSLQAAASLGHAPIRRLGLAWIVQTACVDAPTRLGHCPAALPITPRPRSPCTPPPSDRAPSQRLGLARIVQRDIRPRCSCRIVPPRDSRVFFSGRGWARPARCLE
jgi:hypothetical protein